MEKERETCKYHHEDLRGHKYKCSRSPWKGSKRGCCIFHSENPDKPVEDFEKGIQEKLAMPPTETYQMESYIDIFGFEKRKEDIELETEKYYFRGFCFPKRFDSRRYFAGREFETNVVFDFAKFLGDVFFNGAKFSGGWTSFNGTEFSGGETSFNNAQFTGGRTTFDGAKFKGKGKTSFIDTKFSGKGYTSFDEAKFSAEKGTFFNNAEFLSDEETHFYNTEFTGERTIFNGARFSGKGETSFVRAKFLGKRQTSFEGVEFSGEKGTYFGSAEFSGEEGISFKRAKFTGKGETSFYNAKFSGKRGTYFNKAEFSGEGETFFIDTQFSGKGTSFRGATFSKSVSFLDSIFYCDKVDFSEISFKGESLSFTGAAFTGEVRFENTVFSNDRVNFWDTIFGCQVIFKKSRFYNNVDFDKTTFNCAKFDSARFIRPEIVSFYDVDLEKVSFLGTDVSKVDFYDCKWPEIDGRLGIFDEKNNKDDSSLKKIEIVYRQLKQNFEERRNYPDAGDFYIGEMEARIRNPTISNWEKTLLWIYRHLSFYGEDYWRPIKWIFVSILVFGPLLMVGGFQIKELEPIDYSWAISPLKFDVQIKDVMTSCLALVKLFTIQGKDIVPLSHWSLILTSLLPPWGILLIALLVLSIKRRFRR